MSGRSDLDSFDHRTIYRHMPSGVAVEFLGIASMPELDGEDVGVFRFMEGGGCLIATKRGHAQGETFTPIVQEEEVDEAPTAEWRAFVDRNDS